MKSQDALSELYIEHGLGDIPLKVDIQVKVNDQVFPGQRSVQSEDDSGIPYGGINYVYNVTHVILVVPQRHNQERTGMAIYTGETSGEWLGNETIQASEVLVRVRVWGQGRLPAPDFSLNWIPMDNRKTFVEVEHEFNSYPMLEVVQEKACGWTEDASGSVMTPGKDGHNRHIGGAVYGVSQNSVTIWTVSNPRFANSYHWGMLHPAKDGWGIQGLIENPRCASGSVRVLAWKEARYKSLSHASKKFQNNDQMSLNVCDDFDLENGILSVYVEAHDGVNKGYRFIDQGSAQNI